MKTITCLLCARTAVARFWNVRIACSLALWIAVVTGGAAESFEAVEFETSGGGRIHASLFEGRKDKAVVLAHGAIFNKESWYPLALRLKKEGLTSLSIDFRGYGQSTAELKKDKHFDVLGAVAFLRSRGYESISLVGGSMGGMAVLEALERSSDPLVHKVIILAAPGGRPIASTRIAKLFVVSEGDPAATNLKAIYEKSAEPKQLKMLSGSAHAQHIFGTTNGPALTEWIAEFLR